MALTNDSYKPGTGRIPWASTCVLAVVFVLSLVLSLNIEWNGDALLYRFNFSTQERLCRVSDIPESIYAHYFSTNGRILPHIFVQLFCAVLGKTAFAVCNAFAYVCLVLLLTGYAGGNWRNAATTLSVALLTLFFCDTSYIPPNQIGYVWASCMAVLFLIVYDRQQAGASPGVGRCMILFIIGVLCGNCSEAINLGLGAAMGIDMLRRPRTYGRARWMLLAGFGIGLCLICLSPAAYSRAEGIYRPPLYFSVYTLLVSMRAFWVFIAVLAVALLRRKVTLRGFASDNWLLLTAMAVMFVFNLLITVKGNRQLFGIELYSVIMTLRLLGGCRFPAIWLVAGTVVVGVQYYMKFVALSQFNACERALQREYIKHGNSPLYLDLTHHNPWVQPTQELTYHDCVNLYYHYSYAIRYLNSERGLPHDDKYEYIDSVVLYPVALKQIMNEPPANRVVYVGNGVYMLLRLKSHPARFVLHRSLDIAGWRRPLPPVEISFDASQHRGTDIYDVYISSFPTPLMHADSVSISR